MAKIVDPDMLNQNTEVTITPSTKKIRLNKTGNLSDDGVTLQCIYSFLKEEWKDDVNLIKYPFPLIAITEEQFECVGGWDWEDDISKQLIRDGGWALKDSGGASMEEYMNVTTLGPFDNPNQDKAYYLQDEGGQTTQQVVLTGSVNQAVKIFGDATHGDVDVRSFFQIFLREQGKIYASYDLPAEQELSAVTYKKYAMPLANRMDLKVTHNDAEIESDADTYGDIDVTYLPGNGFGAWSNGVVYEANAVVKDNDRFYITAAGGTSAGTGIGDDTGVTDWSAYSGERQIGDNWFPFDIIIEGGDETAEEIYEKVAYLLRRAEDIDEGAGSIWGTTADDLLEFIGDTLRTKTGVFIDNYNATDTNRLEFEDSTNVVRTFPYVASGKLIFNDNLQNDPTAKYVMFFNDISGHEYGSDNAIIVQSKDGSNISGDVGGQGEISFDFDYDGNVQGGRTAGQDAKVTVVALGLGTAQFVKTTITIIKSTANNISLVAALERNYDNPA